MYATHTPVHNRSLHTPCINVCHSAYRIPELQVTTPEAKSTSTRMRALRLHDDAWILQFMRHPFMPLQAV